MRVSQFSFGVPGAAARGWRFVLAAACLFSGVFSTAAQAIDVEIPTTQYFTHYGVTMLPGTQDVTNIILFEDSSTTWAFQVTGGGDTDPVDSVISNPFAHDIPVQSALMMGLMNDGANHVVLFMDPIAAVNAQGVAWETLFPNTVETELIGSILDHTAGYDFDDPRMIAAQNALSAFTLNDAMNLPFASAWFAMDGPFAVVTFSNGNLVGFGAAMQVAVVPEPETYALMLAGLGLVGWAARRRAVTV